MVNYKNKLSAPLANSFQKGVIAMEIRFAETRDIPGMINLLLEVGEVHHRIRPDLFRAGAQKYDEQTLARMLTDDTRPIFVAVEDGKVLGYCFCILQVRKNDPVLLDDRTLYIDDLCVDEACRGCTTTPWPTPGELAAAR